MQSIGLIILLFPFTGSLFFLISVYLCSSVVPNGFSPERALSYPVSYF